MRPQEGNCRKQILRRALPGPQVPPLDRTSSSCTPCAFPLHLARTRCAREPATETHSLRCSQQMDRSTIQFTFACRANMWLRARAISAMTEGQSSANTDRWLCPGLSVKLKRHEAVEDMAREEEKGKRRGGRGWTFVCLSSSESRSSSSMRSCPPSCSSRRASTAALHASNTAWGAGAGALAVCCFLERNEKLAPCSNLGLQALKLASATCGSNIELNASSASLHSAPVPAQSCGYSAHTTARSCSGASSVSTGGPWTTSSPA
mmetsp:Transcript_57905/g.133019  ORF Transcript_57905/g.133019 Transcript_57905/m.133019 type:complete len:263 (-) Transcript_57905:380-1168(-)